MDSSRVGDSSPQNAPLPPSDIPAKNAGGTKNSFLGRVVKSIKGKKEPGLNRAVDTESLSKLQKGFAWSLNPKIRKIDWRRATSVQLASVNKLQVQNGKSGSKNSVEAYNKLAKELKESKNQVKKLEKKIKNFESEFSDALKLNNKKNIRNKDLKKVKNLKIPNKSDNGFENIEIKSSNKGQTNSQVEHVKEQLNKPEIQACFQEHLDNKSMLTEAIKAKKVLESKILYAHSNMVRDLKKATKQEYEQDVLTAINEMEKEIARAEEMYSKGIAELEKSYPQNIENGVQKKVHVNSSLGEYKKAKNVFKHRKEKNIENAKEHYKNRIKDFQKARTQKREKMRELMQDESKQVTETTAPSTIPVDMKNGASEPLKKSNIPAYTEDRQWESDIEAIFKSADMAGLETIEASELLEKFNAPGYIQGRQWESDIQAIFRSGDMAVLETIENTLKQLQEDHGHSDFANVLEYIQDERKVRSDRWYE